MNFKIQGKCSHFDKLEGSVDRYLMTWVEPFLVLLGEILVRLHHLVKFSLDSEKGSSIRKKILLMPKYSVFSSSHLLVLAGALCFVVQQSVCICWLDHLYEDGGDFAFQSQKAFCKGGRSHLDAALVRGIDLEVMPVGRVKAKKPQSLSSRVFSCITRKKMSSMCTSIQHMTIFP